MIYDRGELIIFCQEVLFLISIISDKNQREWARRDFLVSWDWECFWERLNPRLLPLLLFQPPAERWPKSSRDELDGLELRRIDCPQEIIRDERGVTNQTPADFAGSSCERPSPINFNRLLRPTPATYSVNSPLASLTFKNPSLYFLGVCSLTRKWVQRLATGLELNNNTHNKSCVNADFAKQSISFYYNSEKEIFLARFTFLFT